MAGTNIRALVIGCLAAGGVLAGAILWQRSHPDAPVPPPLAKLTAPPSLNPPKPQAAPEPPKEVKAPPPDVKSGGGLVKGPPPKPEPASGHGEPPHFDVVRVEPSGDAVLAGKGDPNAKVSLLSGGKVIVETKADPNGQFVLVPPPLRPGDHDLTLRQTPDGKGADGKGADGKGAIDSKQAIAVSVPTKPGGEVVVALAEPGKPTKLLSGPPEAKAPARPAPAVVDAPAAPKPPAQTATATPAKPETAVAPPAAIKPPGPDLAIRSVELENGNGFFATGVAAPDTRIQVYLNDAHLADIVAGRDGQWSVTVKKGLTAGHYIVRADASGEGRAVTARVEVPFDVPVTMAAKSGATPDDTPKDLGKPNEPPADVASRMPHEAPPLPNVPKAVEAAEAPAEPKDLGKPNEPPADVVARMPHEAPPLPNVPTRLAEAKPAEAKPAEAKSAEAKPAQASPEAPAPKRTESTPSVAVPSTPPEPPAVVPTPRPDVAAAAKAKGAAAPAAAPPVLAVAPPVPPEQRPTPPAAEMHVSPPRPAAAPPTLTAEKPMVAPPKVAAAPEAAPAAPSPDPSPAPPSPSAANAVIEQIETVKVVRGDNLWNISRDRLGGGYRYTRIYEANNDQIRDPKLIYPGQVFVLPSGEVAK